MLAPMLVALSVALVIAWSFFALLEIFWFLFLLWLLASIVTST